MRRSGLLDGVVGGGALAAALVSLSPLTAAAASQQASARAQPGPAAGVLYGGLSSQRLPVVLEVSRNGLRVVRVTIAIRLQCTSGGIVVTPDSYGDVSIRSNGRFRAAFGPQVIRNDDGTTTDLEGRFSGAVNRAGTRASGTWQFKATSRDAAGAVTDTCDSGTITWRAKQ